MTTLVSHYGSGAHKGKVMGTFRSLGALARAVGPVFASICNFLLFDNILRFVIYLLKLIYLCFSVLVNWSKDNLLHWGYFVITTMVFIKENIKRQ